MLLPCVFQNEITGWENTTLGSSSRNWAAWTRWLPQGMHAILPATATAEFHVAPPFSCCNPNDFYGLALKWFCLEVYPTVHVYTLHQWHILGFQVFDHYSVYPGRKIVSLCLLSPNKLCLWPFYLRHKSSSLSVSSYSVLPMNWTHHSHLYSKNSWSAVLHIAYAL